MLISELIEKLQEIQNVHNDLEVKCYGIDQYGYAEVKNIEDVELERYGKDGANIVFIEPKG